MQLLGQASQLSKKGQIYQNQGNYDYAANCYKKVITILQGLIMIQSDQQKNKQLKDKVTKYKSKFQEMILKEKQKNIRLSLTIPKISKLGFPIMQKQKEKEKINVNKEVDFLKNLHEEKQYNKKQQIIMQKKGKNQEENKNNLNNNNKPLRNTVNAQNQFKNYNQKMLMKDIQPEIKNLIIQSTLTFQDIVGMDDLKKTLQQAIIRPRKRPDLYTGIRAPPRGLLLYGPPGNGKTYICKALANESGCAFFALSASVIMNKLVGESQKMLRKIFDAASQLSPSIIFIDEIDSILTARSENENQASRRLKTEFLILLDGISSPKSGQIIVIGATNLPKQLDLAARRRFNKLIFVGMPDKATRQQLILKNIEQVPNKISKDQIKQIVKKLQGYSASEITNIVKEVCMVPLREITTSQLQKVNNKNIREVTYKDFIATIKQIPPLLSKEDLLKYEIKV